MSMNLLSLPDVLLLRVIQHLGLKDLLSLGDCNNKLREIVYKSPEIWTSDLLFPIGDKSITDKFIQRIIPRITRHYGILELKMIDLPLTWAGYLMIFDQFAHSVNRIEIHTSLEELNKLSHHLSIFAGNLAMLQQNNKIPITFRQYALDDEEEFSTALGQNMLHSLYDQFASMKLDDPPFERLVDFRIVANNQKSNYLNTTLRQLELLASFLSGRPITQQQRLQQQQTNQNTPKSPIPTAIVYNNNKRTRENNNNTMEYSSSNSNKHVRHDNNEYYYHRQQQQQDQQQQQQQQQQQESPQQLSYRSYA